MELSLIFPEVFFPTPKTKKRTLKICLIFQEMELFIYKIRKFFSKEKILKNKNYLYFFC